MSGTLKYFGSTTSSLHVKVGNEFIKINNLVTLSPPNIEGAWYTPVVEASSIFDQDYFDTDTHEITPKTVNLDRGQIANPLNHPHCPARVTLGWSSRVEITTAQNPQSIINSNPAGTVFVLKSGTHQNRRITLRTNDILVGEEGAIMDGSGLTASSGADARAIYAEGASNVIVYNVIVQNYPFFNDGSQAPYGPAVYIENNSLLINCEIRDNANVGVQVMGPNAYIRFCITRRNGRMNYVISNWMGGATKTGCRLEYCESDTANIDDWDETWEACHKFVHVDGMAARYNYFHDDHGYGLWWDSTQNVNNLIEYNVIKGLNRSGIHYEIGSTATIRYNTIEDCGGSGAIFISNSEDCEVYGNVLLWNNSGLWLADENRGGPRGINNSFHDNHIFQKDHIGTWPTGKAGVHYSTFTSDPLVSGNVWSNNHYYIDAPDITTAKVFEWLPSNLQGDTGEMNFATWSSIAGEAGSTLEAATSP